MARNRLRRRTGRHGRPTRDYRREVYAWEDGSFVADTQLLTWESVRAAVKEACAYYGVKPPAVKKRKGPPKSLSYYDTGQVAILLSQRHHNPYVVLHEAAHHICTVLFADRLPEDHGKPWLGIYQWLLLRFRLFGRRMLCISMRGYHLPYCPLSPSALAIKA